MARVGGRVGGLRATVSVLVMVAGGCTASAPDSGSPSASPSAPEAAEGPSAAAPQSSRKLAATPFIPSARDAGAMPACASGGSVVYPTVPPLSGPPAGTPEIVGGWGGTTRAVATLGSQVLVGVGATLVAVDLSDPADPREAAVSPLLGGPIEGITVAGGRVLVAAGPAGLYALDVDAGDDPIVVGHVPLPGYASSVAVRSGHALVAAGTRGLRVVALDGTPREVASLDDGTFASGVVVEGGLAYVAAGHNGLMIVDVTDPALPRVLATVAATGFAYDVAISQGTAYVADAWEGVMVVDISDPAMPHEAGRLEVPGWAFSVTVRGDELAVATGLGGVRLFDLVEPRRPAATEAISFPASHVAAIDFVRDLIVAADARNGVHVIERTPGLSVVGLYAPLGVADGIAVAGDRAYVAAGDSGLRLLDVADRTAPWEIAAFEAPGYTQTVTIVAGHAMVTSFTRELFVIDARDHLDLTGDRYGFELGTTRNTIVHGTTLLMANEWGLRVFDVSEPGRTCQLSFLNVCGAGEAECPLDTFSASGVAAIGPIAYLVGGTVVGGVRAIDISDPTKPTLIGALRGSFEDVVALDDRTLALIGRSPYDDAARLAIVDVTDPGGMREVATFELPALSAGWGPLLARVGRSLFVSAGSTLVLFDLMEGVVPRRVASLPMPGGVSAIAADDGHVYAATESAGVTIVRYADAPDPSPQTERALRARYRSRSMDGHVEDATKRPTTRSDPPPGRTCLVTTVATGGLGSLHECLGGAGAGDTIRFDPQAFPPHRPATIELTSALPPLSAGHVTIDASDAGVVLDGSAAPSDANGLLIESDGNVVKGLHIQGFSRNGILIQGGRGNTIGGDRSRGAGPSGQGNVVSGNGATGIETWWPEGDRYHPHVRGNVIVGNHVGLDADGATVIGNGDNGVQLGGAHDRLGGSEPWERNAIAGSGLTDVASDGSYTRIVGNYIGTDASGRRAVSVTGHWAVQLGAGYSLVEGNVIAGTRAGIWMERPNSGNEIVGNVIGFDATGAVEIGEAWGIAFNQGFIRIGGLVARERNLVGGGIVSRDPQSRDAFILGNWLGVTGDGRPTAPAGAGPRLDIAGTRHIVLGNTVVGGGLRLLGGSSDNLVAANNIAVDPTGRTVLGGDTIRIIGSHRNAVQFNRIGAAPSDAVIIEGDARDNVVRGNVAVR